jgi:hypothetical protein
MPTIEELAAKYGSGGATDAVITPHADLINRYGSGTVAVEAPAQSDIMTPSPESFERSKILEAETAAANVKRPIEYSKLPIVRQGIKGFEEGGKFAGEGLVDISKGKPATGLGKFILGSGQQFLNVLPVLPALEVGKEQINKIVGSETKTVPEVYPTGTFTGRDINIPSTGERAEALITSGLPVAKIGKVAIEATPSSRAVKTIVDSIGPENLPSVIQQLKSNPRLTLMDVDPNIQIISQGLAARPGEPRNILDKVVRGRTDTKLDTVTGAIDEAMGTPVNVLEKVEGLKKQLRLVGAEINPVIKSTGPVDISPVVANIDTKLKPGVTSVISAGEPLPLGDIEKSLERVRNFITDNKSFRTDPQSLHNFQSALRAKAEDLLSSTSGQDRQLGKALMDVRNQVVDAIDTAGKIPGEYKSKLSAYRDEYHVTDAFKKGQLITKNRLGNLEDDPSYWEKWVKDATPAELEAAKEGARLAYAHQMGTVTNAARKGTDIPLIEFNKEKLNLLFGKAEVDKMAKDLADEKLIADTNSKLFQGSMTAMRQLGAEATKVRPEYEPKFTKTILPVALEAGTLYLSGGNIPAAGFMAGLTYPYVRGKMTKIGQTLDRKTNVEITNLAASTGEAKETLIKALQEHIPKAKLSLAQKSMLALPIAKF